MTTPLGRRIRELRVGKSYTLRAFAEKVGIVAPHLCEIELGRRNPSPEVLVRIARVLGTKVGELEDFDTRKQVNELKTMIEEDPRLGPALVRLARQTRQEKLSIDDLIRCGQ